MFGTICRDFTDRGAEAKQLGTLLDRPGSSYCEAVTPQKLSSIHFANARELLDSAPGGEGQRRQRPQIAPTDDEPTVRTNGGEIDKIDRSIARQAASGSYPLLHYRRSDWLFVCMRRDGEWTISAGTGSRRRCPQRIAAGGLRQAGPITPVRWQEAHHQAGE